MSDLTEMSCSVYRLATLVKTAERYARIALIVDGDAILARLDALIEKEVERLEKVMAHDGN